MALTFFGPWALDLLIDFKTRVRPVNWSPKYEFRSLSKLLNTGDVNDMYTLALSAYYISRLYYGWFGKWKNTYDVHAVFCKCSRQDLSVTPLFNFGKALDIRGRKGRHHCTTETRLLGILSYIETTKGMDFRKWPKFRKMHIYIGPQFTTFCCYTKHTGLFPPLRS